VPPGRTADLTAGGLPNAATTQWQRERRDDRVADDRTGTLVLAVALQRD
jgi:hypothetical protein